MVFRDKDGNLVQRTGFEGLTKKGIISVEDYANRIRTTLQEQKTEEIQRSETPMPNGTEEKPKDESGKTPPNKEGEAKDGEKPSHEELKSDEDNLKPVGAGAFGPVYDQFRGKPKEAVAFLSEKQDGEALGALHHDAVGDIDLVWGKAGTKHSDGFGLSKLVKYHPEVVEHLQEILNDMKVDKVSPNRINLSSDKYKAAIRLDYDGESKTWLLTAYEKEKSSDSNKTTDTVTVSSKGDTALSQSEDSSSDGKDTTKSYDLQENNGTLTFKDGTPIPMDEKGEPDFTKMTPEHGAEKYKEDFGGEAGSVIDDEIKQAEKDLKDANKRKIEGRSYSEKLKSMNEKKAAEAEAQKKIDTLTGIKKVLTQQKVAEGVGDMPKSNSMENASEDVKNAVEKFQKSPKVRGRHGAITLADGAEIEGTYQLVEADALIPSHDPKNGFKPHKGAPLDTEGRTVNDRDYEHEEKAQDTVLEHSANYNGKAVDNVPVVLSTGHVISGNERTMAGQLAAEKGTDKAYVQSLKKNAEGFGLKAEDVDKMEHPRVVFVPDTDMPYTTETFRLFNKEDKKRQGSTAAAIVSAKTLKPGDVGAIVSEIEGSGTLEAFFNNPSATISLMKALVKKGIIGTNELDAYVDSNGKLTPEGKEMVKNLLIGSVFTPETIRMMGNDAGLKTKVVNGIRAVMDNLKLGKYSLKDEVDGAVRLLAEARASGNSVDDHLRQQDLLGENASDRYSNIEQALAKALEGNSTLFRDLMREYNELASHENSGEEGLFREPLTKDELIQDFIKYSNIIKENSLKTYGKERNSEKEGGNNASGDEEHKGTSGGRDAVSESQQEVDEAVKTIATEITKQTGIEVVTDEKVGQGALEDAEATDSNIRYHKETNKEILDELNNGETVKVYRAMQVIDGKLYPPMAASVDGKLVEANDLGVWIRADENPDLAIPDIDPKTGRQKVDPKTGELKWKFKLDKGGKDATGKKATNVNAAYNPYWHMSRSPLNDLFKSAWIRPNIVVVECEVPVSELTSGYKAEKAKDVVGEVDWKSGSVSGEVFKQTGRARKVILSRWCKPVRVLSDAEVAQRAKEFVGEAKVEIPENVLTPKQRIAFEEAGFKIGAPEKGVKKSEQILEALERGLLVDNAVKEHRASAGSTIRDWGKTPKELRMNESQLTDDIMQYAGSAITRLLPKAGEDGVISWNVKTNGNWYFFRVDQDYNIMVDYAVPADNAHFDEFKEIIKDYGVNSSPEAFRRDMQKVGIPDGLYRNISDYFE